MKTSELTSAALDWAVAKCEGYTDFDPDEECFYDDEGAPFIPSADWLQGGPIIERESISLMKDCDDIWQASIGGCTDLDEPFWQAVGSTPLIAAMRCYVASKLGNELKIPKELENANQKS